MVDLHTKKTMRLIIMAQCTGTLGNLIFTNGILLAYLAEMGMASTTILQLLALPTFIGFIFLMPAAFWSDRFGMKKLGTLGLLATSKSSNRISAVPKPRPVIRMPLPISCNFV